MIENLTKKQLSVILDVMPFEMVVVDEKDCVQFANKVGTRRFPWNNEVVGRDVRLCHSKESLPKVDKILSDLRSGQADEAEFWIPNGEVEQGFLNRFIALRDESGKYLGILEYVLDFAAIKEIAEEKKGAPVMSVV